MKQIILILSIINMTCKAQGNEDKTIMKNQMKVSWYFENDKIHFEMNAPTNGWVTIGFNTKSGTIGAYLLMGKVINNKVNLVEYYTKSPGNYFPISKLGAKPQVENIQGIERSKNTTIKFSLPTQRFSKYQRDLSEGNKYKMIIAYSQKDDFQHHSIMRTSTNVKL